MSENTKIEWCDHTFNPWEGCQKVGPGCDHCYAETRNARFGGGTAPNWGPGAPRHRTSSKNWYTPFYWNDKAHAFKLQHGRRQRVFCASLADVFDNAVDPQWRADLFDLIRVTPKLDWLLLTKRVGNVAEMVETAGGWPANAQLGITVCNQKEAERDIPKALATKTQFNIGVVFLSMEPLLGPVNIFSIDVNGGHAQIYPLTGTTGCEDDDGNPAPDLPAIDWVIVGGESGSNARPMHPDWARNLRDQCKEARVAFHFNQWGEHDLSYDRDRDDPDWQQCSKLDRLPGRWINLAGGHGFHGERVHYAHRVGKKKAGRLLDGREWNEFPKEGQ